VTAPTDDIPSVASGGESSLGGGGTDGQASGSASGSESGGVGGDSDGNTGGGGDDAPSGGQSSGGEGGMGGAAPTGACVDAPCQHGGTCEAIGDDAYSCDCPGAYTGEDCSLPRFELLPAESSARHLSPDGTVLISDFFASPVAYAYVGGETVELEPFIGDLTVTSSATNEGGTLIVGSSYDQLPNGDSVARGVTWTQIGGEGTPLPLPTSGTPPYCEATDISLDGSVIAGTCAGILVRWQRGVLDEIGKPSWANDCMWARVSGDGDALFAMCDYMPVRWTPVGGFTALDLPDNHTGGFQDVSEDGLSGVGDCSNFAEGPVGCVWRGGSTFELMDALWLGPGDSAPRPWDISDSGEYIVGSVINGAERVAVRWDSAGTPERVVDLLSDAGGSAPGWTLLDVRSVSADGQTLLGSGDHEDGARMWIVRLD